MLRKELSKSSGFDYAEYHGHAKALHGDRFYLRQASGAHVRSFVVLRDPYEQAVSEYDDFWEEYEKRPNDQLLARMIRKRRGARLLALVLVVVVCPRTAIRKKHRQTDRQFNWDTTRPPPTLLL